MILKSKFKKNTCSCDFKNTLYHNLKYELGDHNSNDELSVCLILW
jgi:hypothetical protein